MKKLLTRYRNWTITGHLCRKYGYVPDDVRPLVDSMGEFGAELTLYVAKRFNLGLGDAREQALNAMVHLSRSLVKAGVTAEEAATSMGRAAKVTASQEGT